MDEGDINAFYGADGELYYQRWDGQQWSAPARMLMESVEVLCLKSRIKRLEEAIKPFVDEYEMMGKDFPEDFYVDGDLGITLGQFKKAHEVYYADGPDVG